MRSTLCTTCFNALWRMQWAGVTRGASPSMALRTPSATFHARTLATCRAIYAADFDSLNRTEEEAKPVGRPSKGASKRQERQLGTVLPLLEPYIAQELVIARGIHRTNQARKRQEALVGRMLRGLPDSEQQRIKDTVDAVLQGKPPPSPAADLASYWRQQLVHGDQRALEEVCAATAAAGLPVSDLRQLVRQCQAVAEAPKDTSTEEAAGPAKPTKSKNRAASKHLLQLLLQVANHSLDTQP